MLHLQSPSKKGHITVFLDISSASIGAGIVVAGTKGSDLVWSTRVEYGYQSVHDFERYVRTMYATLLEVGMKVKSEGLVYVKREVAHASMEHVEVRCVYGPPWVFNAVRTEKKTPEKQFQITRKLCEKIQEDAYQGVLEGTQAKQWQEVMGQGEKLETFTDALKVRGYAVDDTAFGQYTNDMETQHFFSIIPESIGGHVVEVIEKLFPNQDIFFTSSTRVLAKSIENNPFFKTNHDTRLLLAEITGEMTNVAFLENGKLCGTTAVSSGINHLLRSVVPNASNAKEACGAAEVQIKTKTNISSFTDLPEVFHDPMKDWQMKVFKAVKNITGGVTPPSKMVVVTKLFWEKVYTTTLSSPYTISGTHNEIQLDVMGVSELETQKKQNTHSQGNIQKPHDIQLYMYLRSV